MRRATCKEVAKLDKYVQGAIWLQTDSAIDWLSEAQSSTEIPVLEDDIVEYVVQDYILSNAANWTNRRIEEYLSHEHDI